MSQPRRFLPWFLGVVSVLSVAAVLAAAEIEADASAYTPIGKIVSNPELPAIDGAKQKPILAGKVTILFFFRPDKEYSRLNLKGMADCDARFTGKPIQITGIVPARFTPDETRTVVKEAGARFPILFDTDEAVYTEIGVAQHPAAAVVDREGKLSEYQPFTKLNFCELVEARARHVLGELSDEQLKAVLNPKAEVFSGDASAAARHVKMAELLLGQGKAKEAVEQGRIAVQKASSSGPAHAVLGAALAATGDCRAAMAEFEAALKLDAADARALEGKSRCAGK